MDRLPGPAARLPGAFPLKAQVDMPQGDLVRVLDLVSGQRLQATVAAVLGQGRVLLGLRGAVVEATSHVELEAGRTYELTVASTRPRIVLTAARPLLPGLSAAMTTGLLGPVTPAPDLMTEILSRAREAGAGVRDTGVPGEEVDERLGSALASLKRGGAPTAGDLRMIQQYLGHDQEIRVLRLATSRKIGDATVLRHTLKAAALRILEGADEGRPEPRDGAARELIGALNSIEVSNVRRSEQGAPQWLPLPVPEQAELKDARMFLFPDPDEEGSGEERSGVERPFTVVLLLDFTSLGQIRVDLHMRGPSLSATIVAVESSTVHSLVADMPSLRDRLQSAGLEIRSLTVRSAPTQLPIADLVMLPPSTSVVDIHA